MELLLWRHAEAADALTGQSDQERRLTARGKQQARHVAAWLRGRCREPLRILVSPAVRCRQTAQALDLPFELEPRIGVAAGAADLLDAAAWPAGDSASEGGVLLVGHQPTLGRVAALLLAGREADWSVKKGALWWFSTRIRDGGPQTTLKAVIGPDVLRD